jgi:tetratricopeptide (TPR) repeat protein
MKKASQLTSLLVACCWSASAVAQAPAAAGAPPRSAVAAAKPAPLPSAAPSPSVSPPASPPPSASPSPNVSPSPSVTPAQVERAKESFRIGAAAYAAGEYLAAIAALDSAFALAPLPAIAFSLAQAERRQYFIDQKPEHLERSVALFRSYLEQTPNGGRRTDAVEALAQLEPLLEHSRAARGAAGAPPPLESRSGVSRLLVIAEAPGAQVFVDGVEIDSTLIREVGPGKHRITVRAPGFRDAEREVVAVSGELIPVSVASVELPGTLEVSAPLASEIYVDGAFASLGGSRVRLELHSGKHRVSVAQNGYRVAAQDVEVTRGELQELSFTLEPTGQRMTSNALLIGGAAVLGASAMLAVLAVQSEDAAQDFLVKHDSRNVTPGELVGYQSDVVRRDRYRLMAGSGLGLSLGLLVTGLFLHELDKPRIEDLSGGFEVATDIGADHWFAGLKGSF